ncbi:MAG: PilZ domain-containing protein [Erythrobacter sp.]|jgi:hypothetical protein|nr:PilZ domain-containing protein [Erythrobacter sp.]
MNQDALPQFAGSESDPASGGHPHEAGAEAMASHSDTAIGQSDHELADEQRRAPRFTLLIRAAKLVSPQGEFVCVIRDVSETGVSLRLFHAMPTGAPLEIQLPSGTAYEVEPIWQRDNEAGLRFAAPVDVARLINEAGEYPKRGLRLDLCFPVELRTLTKTCEAVIVNLSQQGGRFESDCMFAIEQSLRIAPSVSLAEFDEVRAKIRWRRGSEYGVVFDDTFSLGNFARLAARLQAPGLLAG